MNRTTLWKRKRLCPPTLEQRQEAVWQEMCAHTALWLDVQLCTKRMLVTSTQIIWRTKGNVLANLWTRRECHATTKTDSGGQKKTVVHRNSIKEHLSYEASLGCSPTPSYIATLPTKTTAADRIFLLHIYTGIVDSGATHLYIAPSAPNGPPNTSASQISVGTATGHV